MGVRSIRELPKGAGLSTAPFRHRAQMDPVSAFGNGVIELRGELLLVELIHSRFG